MTGPTTIGIPLLILSMVEMLDPLNPGKGFKYQITKYIAHAERVYNVANNVARRSRTRISDS